MRVFGSRGLVQGGQPVWRFVGAVMFLAAAGCAVGPVANSENTQISVERDLLAEAARAVETAPWPQPEPAPIMSWITGGGEDRVTKADAARLYAASLTPADARFETLLADGFAKVEAARLLKERAAETLHAPRVTASDIRVVEQSIQTLRQHRDIYAAAARRISEDGDAVDKERLADLRLAFADMIHRLGKAADALADRLDHDRAETFAAPQRAIAGAARDL